MTITLRSTKGSELTTAELDGNFSDLDGRTKVAWSEVTAQLNTSGLSFPATIAFYKSVFQLYAFNADNINQITGMIHVPKNYVLGTAIYPHIHVLVDTASIGKCRFGMTYSWANETDDHDFGIGPPYAQGKYFSTPQTVYFEHTFVNPDSIDMHVVLESSTPVMLSDMEGDAIIMFNIFRDATHIDDEYPDTVHLMYVDAYYQAQGFGSLRR